MTKALVVDRGDAHLGTEPTLTSLGWKNDILALPPSYDVLPDGSLDEGGLKLMAFRGDARRTFTASVH